MKAGAGQYWALRALLAEAGVDLAELEADEWPAFEWEIDPATGDLWLYSPGDGDVGHAAALPATR